MDGLMSRVLVTGGAGFVGANLVRALLNEGRDVRVLDDLSTGRSSYLTGLPIEFLQSSVTDTRAVHRAARDVSAIIHLAALSGVAPSVSRPAQDFEINVKGTFNVLNSARRHGVGTIVFASSGAVLAGASPPLHEELPPRPLAPYGASKLYGEGALQAFAAVYGFTGIVLRFSNVYGPFSTHKKSVVAAFLRQALRNRPFVIFGNGRQTRDFLHISDVITAIQRSLRQSRSGVFQLGTGVETSIHALARLVSEVAGVPLKVERRPARPGDASRNYVDIRRSRSALQWKPKVTLREGLVETYNWLADHRSLR